MSFHFSDGQSVIEGDFSKLEKLIENLEEPHYVDIGVFASAKTSEGKPVAEYGAYNEFGSIKVKDHPPQRSFIRMPLATQGTKIETYVQKHAQEHMENGDVKAIFEDIGIGGESAIQEAFDQRGPGWKPNAESTVKKKGADAPLIGTGQGGGLLRASVTHRVDGGKE